MKSLTLAVSFPGVASAIKCVFLHGAGCTKVGPNTDSDTDGYWGKDKIIKNTPYCTSRVFVHQDTSNQGWDDPDLQSVYCDAASGGGSEIKDTIVFTHSMGNLIFAAALQKSTCSLASSARWYSLSGPWGGSKAASWVTGLCSNGTSHEILGWLAHQLHYCDEAHPGHVSRAYVTMAPSYPGLSALAQIAQKHVSGAVCGRSGVGLIGKYSAALEALSIAVDYGEDNDGMVGISHCLLPGKAYTKDYHSPFYSASINHADSTCQDGNGDFGYSTRQPCGWYKKIGSSLISNTSNTKPVFV